MVAWRYPDGAIKRASSNFSADVITADNLWILQ